jgi:succinate dehydrogenase/fumarate reductase flavoprotein subunit
MKIGWYNRYSNYEWNSDNRVEIEKGWFIKGDAIQKFASKLDIISDTMQKTISSHNLYCDAVIDSEFGIKKTSLAKIHQPPYVALKLYPVIYTQGGPKRNALCQVVDPFDNAIPILYSAGELRSFWGWMYNGDGNVSECLVTGRIAGANAASLSSC